jgi:hypothetical protein
MQSLPGKMLLSAVLLTASCLTSHASDSAETGSITTFWPLFDYRTSTATGYSNLSILGPLFKRETSGQITRTALRPLFFNSTSPGLSESDILYPIASTSSNDGSSDTQILKLFQKRISREGAADEKRETMLFPFYISGQSEKYGDYTSVFPIYGEIYERFWRDEYHYTLFPLYGRTVKNGTTSTNLLYPFFNFVSGENESGFAFWPLYGQSSKPGVYEKQFVLWPIYISEKSGQNTQNPSENNYLLPFYASQRSPERSATYAPWPFCGVVRDGSGKVIERDYFWPFWLTAEGKESRTDRFIPFYSFSKVKDSTSTWVLWPIYRNQSIESPAFRQDKDSLLYFLFSHSEESWPQAERSRASSTLWPLYAWKRDEDGVRTLSLPAPVEPVIWNDGIERNLAPLWRVFITRWDDKGDGATSLLWNLYWSETRGSDRAWELFPLASYSSDRNSNGFKLLKGLIGYSSKQGQNTLSLFWLPIARWGK